MTSHGWKDATTDEPQVRAWWEAKPDANVAIATGPSRLRVVDVDHGLNESTFRVWLEERGGETYTVRTGRRPEFGVQLYFEDDGTGRSLGGWELDGCTGDVRAQGGYVMAEGSIHPDSGEPYTTLLNVPLAPVPPWVSDLKPIRDNRANEPGQKVREGEGRHDALMSVAGGLRNRGLDADALYGALLPVNEAMCEPPVSNEDLLHIAESAAKYALPGPEPKVTLGKPAPQEPVDWRTRYMTEEQYLNVKPPEFLIDGFLVKGSIAMLGGPVAQRKSIIALNIAHALCTGEPLFAYFDVTEKPARTVYLCPEMGAASFVKRIKQIGLGACVGKTLFIQTMNEHSTALDELDGELSGAVVIVDTITRFLEGDESKSDDMRKFAQKVFRLVNAGATVVLLHHSKKGSTGTLDDGLRGSSELAAFVDSCWITELEDTKRPYDSLSKMRNVKQRDFESDPFQLKPKPGEYYLTMAEEPAPEAVVASKKEAAAREALTAILHEHPQMGINKLREVLRAKGHGKGNKWVTARLLEMRGGGTVLSSA
jgi:archaellum biogenesis ATPase FlaH